MLYYIGNQQGGNMISFLLLLFIGCGEEKTDSAQPAEQQDSSTEE